MVLQNDSVVTEFIFIGFSNDPIIQFVLFGFFLIIYLIILMGNTLIITITVLENSLQTPMYFFLTNLSLLDIYYSSSTVPRILRDLLAVKKTISFLECAAQMYFTVSSGEAECILLAIMAYDRYMAICYPLHYTTVISRPVCIKLSSGTWLCAFLLTSIPIALTMNIHFCGHNKINHFTCEEPQILALGCRNVVVAQLFIFVLGVIILIIPVTFLIISYIQIIKAVFKISSYAGRQKAFSTCGSHVIVTTLFYGTVMGAYMIPRSKSSKYTDNIISVFYLILTPMLNPLIYTLRNKEVNTALRRIRKKTILL
ncbi:olfactory receptor 10A7-like [Discoglossus pictus]